MLHTATGMSKSGLYAHFGSKQELQLVTVEEAGRILAEEVVRPAPADPPGRAQLVPVCEAVSGGWLRPTVCGAVDGLVTNASLISRLGGDVTVHTVVLAGAAALVAGRSRWGPGSKYR